MRTTLAGRCALAAAVAVVAITSCTPGPTDLRTVNAPDVPAGRWPGYSPAVAGRVNELARVLAAGLKEPQARATLLAALRESRLTEHKVALPEFFDAPAGRALLAAAARQTGRTRVELAALIAATPAMDLYVPYRRDRLEWHAAQPLNVAALVDEDHPVYAYTAEDDSTFYDRRSSIPMAVEATMLLGPREAFRDRPDATILEQRAAATIEDPREMTIGDQQCWEDCGGGGGGGGPPPPSDTLWGDTLVTHGICDNGNCGEGNEFEISVIYPTGTGYTVRCEGIGSTEVIRLRYRCNGYTNKLSETAPNESPYNDLIRVIETDGFSADDWFYAYQDPPSGGGASGESAKVINYSFRNYAWVLYKVNYGAGCTPWCSEWVEFQVKW